MNIISAQIYGLSMFTSIENREDNFMLQKTLTFSTSGPDLRDKQFKFQKNNFIFLILAYSRSHTCF